MTSTDSGSFMNSIAILRLYSVQENFEIKKFKYVSDKTEEKKSIDDFMLKRNDIGDFMLKRNGSYFATIFCETIKLFQLS